jgi:hypothetical protein
MRRWAGVVPVTVLTVLTLVGVVVGWQLRPPVTPGLTPAMITYIAHSGEKLTVLSGDPVTAARLWKKYDAPYEQPGGCKPRLLAISLVRVDDGTSSKDHGVWWAVYSKGQYQPSFGGSGGSFCAHSLSWINPATLRFRDDWMTF